MTDPVDAVGRIESRGIDYIPKAERHASPWNLFWILIGGDLAFSLIVFGWLPVSFGLDFWQSCWAIIVGNLIGALILAPMSLFGPRTGTNNSVSSGALFGVVGRIIGSALALFSALGFVALAVWTGGQAMAAALAKLAGVDVQPWMLAVSYAAIVCVVVGIAVLGHANLVLANKFMVPAVGVMLLIGVVVLAPQFTGGVSGNYLLGSFVPTWVLAVITVASVAVSYGPFVGDWSRYVPRSTSPRKLLLATGSGVFIGLTVTCLFGAFTASMFVDPATDYVLGLTEVAPGWYAVPILLIGLIGGCGQGAIGLYGTGLDFSSLVPRLSRVAATLTIAAVATALVYIGTFVVDAVSLINAFVVILLVITTPWMVIMIEGFIYRRGLFHPADLQVFNEGRAGGRYWFTGGVNYRAVCAWVPGIVVGLLFTATTVFTGPLAAVAGGMDLSFILSGVVAGVVYAAVLKVVPESPAIRGARFGSLTARDGSAVAEDGEDATLIGEMSA